MKGFLGSAIRAGDSGTADFGMVLESLQKCLSKWTDVAESKTISKLFSIRNRAEDLLCRLCAEAFQASDFSIFTGFLQ